MGDLHKAVYYGSMERAMALLSQGLIDIDELDRAGQTPLMCAAMNGHVAIARMLVSRGADVSIVSKLGSTALLVAAQQGHAGVTEVMIEAGAEVTYSLEGTTPLHMAVFGGHWEVMRLLIEAGADVDSRCLDGEPRTPLLLAAEHGRAKAVRELLRAKADPLLALEDQEWGDSFLPLDVAAQNEHLEVIKELIGHAGIEGCGGASGGVSALGIAALKNRVDMMAVLTDAGVVDTGEALVQAARVGGVASAKFLLQQHQQQRQEEEEEEEEEAQGGKSTGGDAYVNATDSLGLTPLATCIMKCRSSSPKVARLLIDAGADTTSTVPVYINPGEVGWNGAPLALTHICLEEGRVDGKDAEEEQQLKAIRRLLLQVEAVHAGSWLWHISSAPVVDNAAAEGASEIATPSTPLARMMPTLRRRAARRRVLLAALCRCATALSGVIVVRTMKA